MKADDLIDLAQSLAKIDRGSPRQAALKRSISTAYYGLFHALCHECVARTVGLGFKSPTYWRVVTPIYRSIEHGAAKRLFERLSGDRSSTPELKQVARAFIDLQEARIAADYDPSSRYTRKDCLDLARLAKEAVEALHALPLDTRRLIVVQLVTKQR